MSNTKKIIFLLVSLITIISNPSIAYENFDECSIFKTLLIDKAPDLSLDEEPWVVRPYSGLDISFVEEADEYPAYAFVEKIHPDVEVVNKSNSDVTTEYSTDFWKLENQEITSINNKPVSTLNEEQFWLELDKSKIEIETMDYDDKFLLQRKEFLSFPVYITFDLDSLHNVSTKNASIDIKGRSLIVWHDWRLSKIGFEVWEKSKNHTEIRSDEGFVCKLPTNALRGIGYPIPNFYINDFESDTTILDDEYFVLNYSTPSACDELDCLETEREFGRMQLEITKSWQGTVNQQLELYKFPFDKQTFEVRFTAEQPSGVVGGFHELIKSVLLEDTLDTNMVNLFSSEWNFESGYTGYYHFYEPQEEVRVPGVSIEIDASRYPNYYVFKVFVPITFILIICWSVFWISPRELESRLTLSVVSLLSLIAYNFVVDDSLPKLGYLTLIDEFILYSYIFAGVPTLQTVLCKALVDRDRNVFAEKLDKDFRLYHPLSYVVATGILFWDYGVI